MRRAAGCVRQVEDDVGHRDRQDARGPDAVGEPVDTLAEARKAAHFPNLRKPIIVDLDKVERSGEETKR